MNPCWHDIRSADETSMTKQGSDLRNAPNLLRSYSKLDVVIESLKDQNRSVESGTLVTQPHSEENHRAKSWRAIPYRVVLLSFVFLAALAWTRQNLNGREFRTGSRFLHLQIRREKEAISITQRVYICKWETSQPRAMIGQVHSQPPAGSKNGQGKGSLFSNQYASSSRYGCSRGKAKSIRNGSGRQSIFSIGGGQSRLHGPVAHPNELG